MIQQLSLAEPRRVDEGLVDLVYGSQDIKFIIKVCSIPDKPKQYNHIVGGKIEGYTRPDGTIVRYNRETNDFAVKSKDGSFQTMFKPDNKYEYYLNDRFKHTGS